MKRMQKCSDILSHTLKLTAYFSDPGFILGGGGGGDSSDGDLHITHVPGFLFSTTAVAQF
jgi:hypothetical protein